MTAKWRQLSIAKGITYLLSKLHNVWLKTELDFVCSCSNLLRASVSLECSARVCQPHLLGGHVEGDGS